MGYMIDSTPLTAEEEIKLLNKFIRYYCDEEEDKFMPGIKDYFDIRYKELSEDDDGSIPKEIIESYKYSYALDDCARQSFSYGFYAAARLLNEHRILTDKLIRTDEPKTNSNPKEKKTRRVSK